MPTKARGSHTGKPICRWTPRPLETGVHRVQTELSKGVGGPGTGVLETPGVGLVCVCYTIFQGALSLGQVTKTKLLLPPPSLQACRGPRVPAAWIKS